MNNIFEKIRAIGILPVIALDDAAQAVPLARSLAAGGIPVAEVTFRTAAGEESDPAHCSGSTRGDGWRRHGADH